MPLGNIRKKIIIPVLFFSIFSHIFSFNGFINCMQVVTEESLEELRKLEKKAKLDFLKNTRELNEQNLAQVRIKAKINKLESQITYINISVEKLELEIKKSEKTISCLQQKLSDSLEVLSKSLSALYKAENPSFFEILVSVKNFDDFFDKIEISRYLSNKILKTVNKVNDLIKKIEKNKSMNTKRLEIINMQRSLHIKKSDELELLYLENASAIEDTKSYLDKNSDEIKKINQQIEMYMKKNKENSNSDLKNKSFNWPVKGYKKISSNFYDKTNRKHQHCAIDIAGKNSEGLGIYGAKVTSIAAGDVVTVGNGGGYGLYVVIIHPNGYVSLYGHLSRIVVKSGDKIGFGQLIGHVGNTGFSTGPHLHLEIKKNNQKIDPLKLSWI